MVAGRTGQGLLMCLPCMGREVSSQRWVQSRAPEMDQGKFLIRNNLLLISVNLQTNNRARQPCHRDRGRGLSPSTRLT